MMKKTAFCVLLTAAAVLGRVDPAYAQRASGLGGDSAPQTINFTFGLFAPRGEDGRVDDDVLNANCDRQNGACTFLDFEVGDFKSATIGGEWLLPIGNFIEAGAGISFAQKTVPSVYAEFVDTDGNEIEQDLKLRQIPIAFTVRALPLGQQNPVQPYVGGGINVIRWKYTEEGNFIDFNLPEFPVFTEIYEASGTKVAPVILGGDRYAGDAFTVGGEVRWQKADVDLNTDFAGSKLDLGGVTLQLTLGVRFD
jgi:hypothetical protein